MPSLPARDQFTDSGFFVLRTPLLPLEALLRLPALGPGAPRAAALREWAGRPEIQEALWIASPELVHSLGLLWEQPEGPKARRLEQALYRYLARMAARSTPFGAFAGCSVGGIGEGTRLELAPRSAHRLHTRLDMELLCSLAAKLSADPAVRGKLRFHPNPSLHRVAGRYHHARILSPEGVETVHLIATETTPALEATLARAAGGATADALAGSLMVEDPELTRTEVDAFLDQLIESQLLMCGLTPPVTGMDPLRHLIEALEAADQTTAVAELRALEEMLRTMDQRELGAAERAYGAVEARVRALGLEFKPGHLVQVDLIKPAPELSLDRSLTRQILDALELLHAIRRDAPAPSLEAFKERFRERYGNREAPLLEALDDEAGIGFEPEDNPTSEPLIASIDFRPSEAASPSEDAPLPPALAQRLEEVRAKGERVLELDAGLIDQLRGANPLPLPDTFSVMGAVFQMPGAGPGFFFQSAAGPSGANLLTRFCQDEGLADQVRAHIRAEEALEPGKRFAEIAHLPQGRVGNVVCRPDLRAFEIPLMATPGVPPGRQIALSDLTLSLREDRIALRSRRLGAEVLPRLSCAHLFAGARSWKLYTFLCLLQHQDSCPEIYFDWGAAARDAYLPRVTLGDVVVSLARWRIDRELSSELAQGRLSVDAWRERHGVPRLVHLAEGDHLLLIDFHCPLAVETFLDLVRRQGESLLLECFPDPDGLAVTGPEGRFMHEMVIPFTRKEPAPSRPRPARVETQVPAATSLPEPGSEWLFAKLDCSPSHADLLLMELVQPLVADVARAGASDRWFFLRYADPDWHLRLRFHGDAAALEGFVLPELLRRARPFQEQGALWRMRFDRYEPEVARYGGPHGIKVAERFFQLDSELCLALLPHFQSDEGADLRWKAALSGADRLLGGLGFGSAVKKAVVDQVRASREQAWITDSDYRRQLSHAFRAQGRDSLAALLEGRRAGALPSEALAAFDRFDTGLRGFHAAWRNLEQEGRLTAPLPEIAASLVHMHLNRLLRGCHLEQEAVLCDFLGRIYAASLARQGQEAR